jgi:anti-sigma regulatory factor (Ser/Thr protein kinase)
VPRARQALTQLAPGAKVDAVGLAASEALTNVVAHAYGERPGSIHVIAAIRSDELSVLIADDDFGLHPGLERPGMGLGLALIAHAADELAIAKRFAGGTELRMCFRLDSQQAPAN